MERLRRLAPVVACATAGPASATTATAAHCVSPLHAPQNPVALICRRETIVPGGGWRGRSHRAPDTRLREKGRPMKVIGAHSILYSKDAEADRADEAAARERADRDAREAREARERDDRERAERDARDVLIANVRSVTRVNPANGTSANVMAARRKRGRATKVRAPRRRNAPKRRVRPKPTGRRRRTARPRPTAKPKRNGARRNRVANRSGNPSGDPNPRGRRHVTGARRDPERGPRPTIESWAPFRRSPRVQIATKSRSVCPAATAGSSG